jgi:hypothetical protein
MHKDRDSLEEDYAQLRNKYEDACHQLKKNEEKLKREEKETKNSRDKHRAAMDLLE